MVGLIWDLIIYLASTNMENSNGTSDPHEAAAHHTAGHYDPKHVCSQKVVRNRGRPRVVEKRKRLCHMIREARRTKATGKDIKATGSHGVIAAHMAKSPNDIVDSSTGGPHACTQSSRKELRPSMNTILLSFRWMTKVANIRPMPRGVLQVVRPHQ